MSTNTELTTDGLPTTAGEFALWALALLRLPVQQEEARTYRFLVPESLRESLNGAGSVRFTVASGDDDSSANYGPLERVNPGSHMFRWLTAQLQAGDELLHARPQDDVQQMEQVAAKVADAYTLEGGYVNVMGSLEARPILKLFGLVHGDDAEETGELCCWCFWRDGNLLNAEQVEAMDLDDVPVPLSDPPELVDGPEWLQSCLDAVCPPKDESEGSRRIQPLGACVTWCQHVVGSIHFSLHEKSAEIEFAGWAKQLVNGRQLPPVYHCPRSGKASYHLEACDSDRLTVSEAVDTCGESKRRVLADRLETCAETGFRALPEYFVTCPVSGRRVPKQRLAVCDDCRQSVAPDAIVGGRCEACRRLSSVSKDDPRVARLLGEYPKLDGWSRWRLSETAETYVMTAVSWFRRLLVVVRKEPLDVAYVAATGRWTSQWVEVPPAEREELFG